MCFAYCFYLPLLCWSLAASCSESHRTKKCPSLNHFSTVSSISYESHAASAHPTSCSPDSVRGEARASVMSAGLSLAPPPLDVSKLTMSWHCFLFSSKNWHASTFLMATPASSLSRRVHSAAADFSSIQPSLSCELAENKSPSAILHRRMVLSATSKRQPLCIAHVLHARRHLAMHCSLTDAQSRPGPEADVPAWFMRSTERGGEGEMSRFLSDMGALAGKFSRSATVAGASSDVAELQSRLARALIASSKRRQPADAAASHS